MRTNDMFADDRSLNGKHTVSCALPTRGGVCDCWPVPIDSPPWGQLGQPVGTGRIEDRVEDREALSGI